jgi:hypothetical protein
MCLVMMYVGHDNVVTLVVEYDNELLLRLLMEVCKPSMPSIPNQILDVFSLDIGNDFIFLHLIDTTIDSLKELDDKMLHIYHWYPIDGDNCKCAFTWWHMEEHMFPTIVILVRQNLGIPTFRNEIERIFSIFGILIAFCKYHFQQIFFNNFIFVNKNWPSNPRVGCPNFLNLICIYM